ncbi:hypothetical protein [Kitasatospora sp. NPDC002040]|uniref:tetratricopeptide repeat protein n=1 Tax=Kitasatospora sp. NPDC002040 TaxID=3154661 RepID=UPI003319CBDE
MRIFHRTRHRPSTTWRQTTDRAFTLIGDGRYEDAGTLLVMAADLEPGLSDSWFNLALLHKFRRDWDQARSAGLRAVALLDREQGAPDWWNLGITATALQDWALARRAWQAYGMRLPGGAQDGTVRLDLGTTPVRLSPEGEAEVVWGRRLDPARIEVLSIPLPSSGRRWGEVVLHDGAPHGERVADGVAYPVFDEIELWAPSPVPTYVVLLQAATAADRDALERLVADAGYAAEDWTSSVRLLCRACSESRMAADDGRTVHHDPHDDGDAAHPGHLSHLSQAGSGLSWLAERECGIAAPANLVGGLLDRWVAASPATRAYRDLEEVC